MTTNVTTDTTTDTITQATPASAPAVPQMTAADDKALRRVGYVLGGAAVFCAGMCVYTGLVQQGTISNDFNTRSQLSRTAERTAPSSFTVKVSSSQFLHSSLR